MRAITSGDSDQDARRDAAIEHHQAWLEAERDTMGFARVPTAEAKRMVEWLRSVDPSGTAKVEVRRYTGGFLHGKTYLVEDGAAQAAIAGSSNMTYAGLAHNAELNLGTGGGTQLGRQGARVVRALLGAERPLRPRRAVRPLVGAAHAVVDLPAHAVGAVRRAPRRRREPQRPHRPQPHALPGRRRRPHGATARRARRRAGRRRGRSGQDVPRRRGDLPDGEHQPSARADRCAGGAEDVDVGAVPGDPRLQPLGEGLLLRGGPQPARPRQGSDRRLPAGDRGLLARRHRRGAQPAQLGSAALRCGRPGDHGGQPEEGRAADGDAGQQLARPTSRR